MVALCSDAARAITAMRGVLGPLESLVTGCQEKHCSGDLVTQSGAGLCLDVWPSACIQPRECHTHNLQMSSQSSVTMLVKADVEMVIDSLLEP